jgi:hypothetical protein
MGANGFRLRQDSVDRVVLAVGDKVKFLSDKRPYMVRAISRDGRFVICTKPFNLRRTVLYTVIDFDTGRRGPDNYGGLGYETPEQITSAMARFDEGDAEVTVRYDVYLDIELVNRKPPVHLEVAG